MYTYTKLDNISMQMLHHTFTETFSDYQIRLNLSIVEFQTLLQRRGFEQKLSIGALQNPDDELVGLMLIGLRNWCGKQTAYDLLTGVMPAHRKNGITSHMFEHVLATLVQNNIENYLLEVLQDNTDAFELYKKQGFQVVRNFLCFHLNKNEYRSQTSPYKVEYVTNISANEWEQLKLFWDFHPSWQNSIDSIHAVQEDFLYAVVRLDNKLVGYGIIGKQTGDIPQFAVTPSYRCKGIARSIISSLVEVTSSKNIRIQNIDTSCEKMGLFLNALGFKQSCSQYEMNLSLLSKQI